MSRRLAPSAMVWINVLGGCAVWLAPVIAWADAPWADPVGPNFGWLVLGEIVPVTIEAGLLRRWLKLPWLEALLISLWANGASFILGTVVLASYVGFDPTYQLLGNLSDLYYETPPLGGMLLQMAEASIFAVLWACIFSIVVEIIVYPLAYGIKRVRGREMLAFVAVNLISYPAYYGLTLLGVAIVLRHKL